VASSIERIVVRIVADTSGYSAGLATVMGATAGFAFAATRAVESMVSAVISQLGRQASAIVEAGIEWERLGTSFGVMMGDFSKGIALLEKVEALAIATPYSFQTLAGQAQKLMGMGVEGNQIIPTLSRLGDLAAGDSEKLKRLALAYGQVMSAGRFMGTELRQFTEAGIGVADFAKTAGMSSMEFRAAMFAGQIGADNVRQTLNRLTSEGGRFYGMNESQNASVIGQWNALNETIDKFRRRIGSAFLASFDVAGKLGQISRTISAAFDSGAIGRWMENAAKAVDPILQALEMMGGFAIDTAQNWLGEPPNWKDVQSGLDEFSKQAVISFMELSDWIEEVTLKIIILGEKITEFRETKFGQLAAQGPVREETWGTFKELFLKGPGGNVLTAMGAFDSPNSAAAKQLVKVQGRNRAAEVEQKWALASWVQEQMRMGPKWIGVTEKPPVAEPLDMSRSAIQAAGKIMADMQTPLEKFAEQERLLLEARYGVMGQARHGVPLGLAAHLAGPFAGFGAQYQVPGALTDPQMLFGKYQNFLQMEKSLGIGGGKESALPSALARGSAEASAIINQQTSGAKTMQERMLAVQEAIKEKNEAMEAEMKDFNANLKNLPGLTVIKKGKK
jgi:tape measure domain-containing protein